MRPGGAAAADVSVSAGFLGSDLHPEQGGDGKSLENLQDDMYSLIKTMESGMIDIYNENDFVLDLKAGRGERSVPDDPYVRRKTAGGDRHRSSSGRACQSGGNLL